MSSKERRMNPRTVPVRDNRTNGAVGTVTQLKIDGVCAKPKADIIKPAWEFECRLRVSFTFLTNNPRAAVELVAEVHKVHHDQHHMNPSLHWQIMGVQAPGIRGFTCPKECEKSGLVTPGDKEFKAPGGP